MARRGMNRISVGWVDFDNVGSNSDQGSAYVFLRSGGAWTEQQKPTAGDGRACRPDNEYWESDLTVARAAAR